MSRYQCIECNRSYDIYASYASHRRRHRPPSVVCQGCKAVFTTHNQLYKHAYQNGCKAAAPTKTVLAPISEAPITLSSGFISSDFFN